MKHRLLNYSSHPTFIDCTTHPKSTANFSKGQQLWPCGVLDFAQGDIPSTHQIHGGTFVEVPTRQAWVSCSFKSSQCQFVPSLLKNRMRRRYNAIYSMVPKNTAQMALEVYVGIFLPIWDVKVLFGFEEA